MTRNIQPNIRITPRADDFLDRKMGSRGEVFYDQNSNSLRVYDGKRVGGFELARTDLANVSNIDLLAKLETAGLATETFVTTAISNIPEVDLTGYATETFVTTAIGNIEIPEVDLTGYATETFVTTAIGNIEIPEVDLTGYATETFVTTAIGNIEIPEVDLTGLASEDYVDTAISNIEIPEVDLTGLASEDYVDTAISNIPEIDLSGYAPLNNPTFDGIVTLGVQQVVFDRTIGDNWIGSSVVVENGNLSIFEPPTNFNNWLNALQAGDKFTIQPGGQELTVASTSNAFTFVIVTEEVIDETPGESILPNTFWITSFTQVAPASIVGVTKAMVGLGNVTNESKATMFTDPTFTGTTSLQQTTELLNTKTGATGTVDHDFSTGAIWYHSSISADFTANFTNVPTTNNRTIVVTLVLDQGEVAYIPTAVQIDSSAATINWIGGDPPSGLFLAKDIVVFTLIRIASTWTVLGSISSYKVL